MTKTCTIDGCGMKYLAKGLCSKHWTQMKRRGGIVTNNRLSPNAFLIEDEHAVIVLCDTLGNEKARTTIDLEDIELAKKHKWYLTQFGYAMTRINRSKQVFLHRLIMRPPDDMNIDHIDGNPLNNRRNNLRICTQRQNMFNRRVPSHNSTGIVGVSWDKRRSIWRARINVAGKDTHLGYFKSKQDAIEAREKAQSEHFDEFVRKSNLKEAING